MLFNSTSPQSRVFEILFSQSKINNSVHTIIIVVANATANQYDLFQWIIKSINQTGENEIVHLSDRRRYATNRTKAHSEKEKETNKTKIANGEQKEMMRKTF